MERNQQKLPYTSENFRTLLNTVYRKGNEFSQYDFAMWCDNLTMAFDDDSKELNEDDSPVKGIARDIECQWDLFWNEEELRNIDQSKLELPISWYIDWLKELHE
ncbi:hypothetical protein [Psychrobacillus lasiicapitis]|uniref:Uncharacterized protein n=1 Tax=Psychrobacillus lasiicapitis TaxID=1636719 RepID=A0A544TI29_9BACI|nr:hypothetical protein [Psychrobacillus lasiicapitis]TQR17107.1 hypothetical protein FG382_02890 [Psychrobacillus lasiicapitis]GGA24443.1 hypothetical protein GCM10011384_12010 [Psychrobacillus lasiicapitis]